KIETLGSGIIHLSGLLFGIFYVLLDKNGYPIYKPFNQAVDYLMSRTKFRLNFVPTKKKDNKTAATKSEVKEVIEIDQDKIDAILDKISAYGYESLTKVEKDYLFRASKNYNPIIFV
ncbi:MAG: rhomboid family intramembrane serine protease, partial [Bacteroidetes bacterium]|nr:rhomboid family intramembrane serine protease [Bacteroidota bacterium]